MRVASAHLPLLCRYRCLLWSGLHLCGCRQVLRMKYYGVRSGRTPGVYDNWEECQRQVLGFHGSDFRRFSTESEAWEFVEEGKTWMAAPNGALNSGSAKSGTQTIKLVSLKRRNQRSLTTTVPERISTDPPSILFPAEEDVNLENKLQSRSVVTSSAQLGKGTYTVQYDGASKGNPGKAGAGAVLLHPDGTLLCRMAEGLGIATNNVAEYRGLILGLRGALDRGIRRLKAQGDSTLVCQQVRGKWKVNSSHLQQLCDEVKLLAKRFESFSIIQVDRALNREADRMANEGVGLPEKKFLSWSGPRNDLSKTSLARPRREQPALSESSISGNSIYENSVDKAGYILEFDGTSIGRPARAGAGALLLDPEGRVVCELVENVGQATSSAAEYHGLILGLKEALGRGISILHARGDSDRVCQQLRGDRTVSYHHAKLHQEAKALIQQFAGFSIQHVDSSLNARADGLAKKASALSRLNELLARQQHQSKTALQGCADTKRKAVSSVGARSFSTLQTQAASNSCRRSCHAERLADGPVYNQASSVCSIRNGVWMTKRSGRPWSVAANFVGRIPLLCLYMGSSTSCVSVRNVNGLVTLPSHIRHIPTPFFCR